MAWTDEARAAAAATRAAKAKHPAKGAKVAKALSHVKPGSVSSQFWKQLNKPFGPVKSKR